jgi:hypothetical protein
VSDELQPAWKVTAMLDGDDDVATQTDSAERALTLDLMQMKIDGYIRDFKLERIVTHVL